MTTNSNGPVVLIGGIEHLVLPYTATSRLPNGSIVGFVQAPVVVCMAGYDGSNMVLALKGQEQEILAQMRKLQAMVLEANFAPDPDNVI